MRNLAESGIVSINLPFGIGEVEWKAELPERRAAWSLYVELVTRFMIQPLTNEAGLLSDTMDSLHSLFDATREILKETGPDVGVSRNSVGGIAIAVLNNGIRPFLVKWRPLLLSWNSKRKPSVSPLVHEENWPYESKFKDELNVLRKELEQYAIALAKIAGVKK